MNLQCTRAPTICITVSKDLLGHLLILGRNRDVRGAVADWKEKKQNIWVVYRETVRGNGHFFGHLYRLNVVCEYEIVTTMYFPNINDCGNRKLRLA